MNKASIDDAINELRKKHGDEMIAKVLIRMVARIQAEKRAATNQQRDPHRVTDWRNSK